MRQLLIVAILTTFGLKVHSQDVTYFKINGKSVSDRDSADYYRVIKEFFPEKKQYAFAEYYRDSSLKEEGISSSKTHLSYEGLVKSYYPNGKLKSEIRYSKNLPAGRATYYYSNGITRKVIQHPDIPFPRVHGLNGPQEFLLMFGDSTGTIKVKDGNGHYKDLTEARNGSKIHEEGDYPDGLKTGLWKGEGDNFSFEETYEKGNLTSGQSIKDGKIIQYKTLEEMPEFKGGIREFYSYIGQNYRYPKEARNSGVSGTILMRFVIEKNGALTDIEVIKDLGMETGEEAIRVLEKLSKWSPGKQRGIPVRVSYTIPIKLSLGKLPTQIRTF